MAEINFFGKHWLCHIRSLIFSVFNLPCGNDIPVMVPGLHKIGDFSWIQRGKRQVVIFWDPGWMLVIGSGRVGGQTGSEMDIFT